MELRPITSADAPQIKSLECTTTGEPWDQDVDVAVRDAFWFSTQPGADVRVAEVDGQLVGLVAQRPMFATTPEYGSFVWVVAVEVQHHRLGLGSGLLAGAIERSRAIAPTGIVAWHVHRSNSAGLRLTARFGATVRTLPTPPLVDGYQAYVVQL